MCAAMTQLNLSARAYHRILKLTRTIADLAACEEIQSAHLAEALHATQPPEVDVELNISHKTEDLRPKSSAGRSAETHAEQNCY